MFSLFFFVFIISPLFFTPTNTIPYYAHYLKRPPQPIKRSIDRSIDRSKDFEREREREETIIISVINHGSNFQRVDVVLLGESRKRV